MKIPRLVVVGLFTALLMFLPAFSNFYTHDDFFHFSISSAKTLPEFLNFFNLLRPPSGFGWYRPLTTQVFYWLGLNLFSLHPVPLRLLLFINFFAVVVLVWRLARKISASDRIAGIAAFLYAVSATHYAHLYFFSVQELGLALFYLLSHLFFLDYLDSGRRKYYFLSLLTFVISLTCKEWAVTLPFSLAAVGLLWYLRRKVAGLKPAVLLLLPYLLILCGYFYLRFRFYGFAQGDSYVWDISPRIFNTLAWYAAWALNLPEMFVDFIGPGLHLNPNLLRFWGRETLLIAVLFLGLIGQLVYLFYKSARKLISDRGLYLLFYIFWFVITLTPVLFLPWHKFSFYLTVPLFGVVMFIASVLDWSAASGRLRKILLLNFFFLAVATLSLTVRTNWISSGAATAARVNRYVQANLSVWSSGTVLVFYDTPADASLPWSPSGVLKTVLSDNNYFRVFTAGRISAAYLSAPPDKISSDWVPLPARQFLGY
jgi:hypothetical protein